MCWESNVTTYTVNGSNYIMIDILQILPITRIVMYSCYYVTEGHSVRANAHVHVHACALL